MNMNTNTDDLLALLVMEDDDEKLKRLLVIAGITEQPPTPPNDLSLYSFRHDGFAWVVIHFYEVTDPGYVGFALPVTASEGLQRKFVRLVLEGLEEGARADGVDFWKCGSFQYMSKGSNN